LLIIFTIDLINSFQVSAGPPAKTTAGPIKKRKIMNVESRHGVKQRKKEFYRF